MRSVGRMLSSAEGKNQEFSKIIEYSEPPLILYICSYVYNLFLIMLSIKTLNVKYIKISLM